MIDRIPFIRVSLTFYALRFTHYALRITLYALRFTHYVLLDIPYYTGVIMASSISRREMLVKTGSVVGAGVIASPLDSAAAESRPARGKNDPFRYCLNTSTLRGHKLLLVKELEIASKAGYSGVEPWMGEIEDYLKGGGTLKDLGKRIKDLGLTVESGIG